MGSVAAVARNEEGLFMGASAVVFEGRNHPETLEAMACREAISLASDIAAVRVQVASDCQSVISSIQEGTLGTYSHIIQEIRARRSDYQNLSFCYEPRSMNQEPHNLARFVLYNNIGRFVWLLDPPIGVNIPVLIDV